MTMKFDYMSEYKILFKGYCDDPWYSDEPEYYVQKGYIVKCNKHVFKVWDWIFIRNKMWKVEEYDPDFPYKNKWRFKGDFNSLALALARVKELAE